MHYLTVAITFIAILSILVIVHEWGHFIVARMFKIRVDEFSLGFGPRALRLFKLGDTEYNVRWIPLGGFVRIAGMEVDEAPVMYAAEKMAAARSGIKVTDEELENQYGLSEFPEDAKEVAPDGFFAHPAWQRALVIFAGPFMSFALGYMIFFGLMFVGNATNKVDQVLPNSEAQHMGMKAGDKIIGINNTKVVDGNDIVTRIHSSIGKPVTLIVERAGKDLTLIGTPKRTVMPDGPPVGTLGFAPQMTLSFNEHTNVRQAFVDTNFQITLWLHEIESIFSHPSIKKLRQSAGGPIFIAQVTNQAVEQGGESIPMEMAQITLSLALFNLLPIPILDGGYLLMFFIEAVFRRGKRLTFQQQQNFMLAGLAMICCLFVFIMFNDISRAFHPGAQ